MTKVLCIGNNTEDTNKKTQFLALRCKMQHHGLVTANSKIVSDGFYHTSVYDIMFGELVSFAKKNFTKVIVLDQAKHSYSHSDAFYLTINAAESILENVEVEFLDSSMREGLTYFEQLVKSNPSFCIFPFIELLANNGHTTVCCRSNTPVVRLKELKDFQTDNNYQNIRKSMLLGEKIPDHCNACYRLEDAGILSARQQETVEWANRLDLTSVDDLIKIDKPVYYEVRASNKCNLACRSCSPQYSYPLQQEFKKLNLISINAPKSEYVDFDIIDFEKLQKLYVAGGEPTIMPEFLAFMRKCIQEKNTNFELQINTNGLYFSQEFKSAINHFSNTQFIFSIDGYQDLNYYIRYPSKWKSTIQNVKWAKQQGYTVSFNVTVSIYNISRLYELLHYIDTKFPGDIIHCQLAEYDEDILSPMNYPVRATIEKNLSEIRNLKCYNNSTLLTSFIDGLIYQYQTVDVDTEKLRKFFKFNNLLDTHRNVDLKNYLPELDSFRYKI